MRVKSIAIYLFLFPISLGQGAGKRGEIPSVGYLYPAGGKQGTEFIVTVGGEGLQSVTGVHISGEGVHATVEQYIKGLKSLFAKNRTVITDEIRSRSEGPSRPKGKGKGKGGAKGKSKGEKGKMELDNPATETPTESANAKAKGKGGKKKGKGNKLGPDGVPNHPLLHDMKNLSNRELQHANYVLLRERRKGQEAPHLAQLSILKITIEPDAAPGTRELRLISPNGMSNALNIQVGTLPEFNELEPNDPENFSSTPDDEILAVPVVFNGQILPGDIDHFRFEAQKGQKLVLSCHARDLIPYIADAVPGWFQATLTLYDADGRELAFTDDFHFHPDPVLFFEVPETGVYDIKVQDSLFRGREDFVYRLSVSERPFVTSVFPLGAKEGSPAIASLDGWNLPGSELKLDTRKNGERIRWTNAMEEAPDLFNDIVYSVDRLDEMLEVEPNNSVKTAQTVRGPVTVNGRIVESGDVDLYHFYAKTGFEIIAEVLGRRLNSPIDSLLRLMDEQGKVLQWNDDYAEKEGHLHKGRGLLTHHADSYLRMKFRKDGNYYLQISDVQNHGSRAHGYRLRISFPEDDFTLRMTPSKLDLAGGATVPVTVYVTREDGFEGPIEVALKDAPEGLTLSGATIPAGRSEIRMTLSAYGEHFEGQIPVHLEGRALVNGQFIIRPVRPADDVMQAFLYRHLMPTGEMLISETTSRRKQPSASFQLASRKLVQLPTGGTATVVVKGTQLSMLNNLELELQDPPAGISLRTLRIVNQSLEIQLKADAELAAAGLRDNLIIEAFHEVSFSENRKKNAKRPGGKENREGRFSAGILPAVSIEVVQR